MIRVLIVDDSAVVRRTLSSVLSRCSDIEVVATAVDPYVARNKILKLCPDVVTLDLQMPRMDGLTFLAKLMKYHPLPVVVVSAMTPASSELALRAMELGAVGVMAKTGVNCVGEVAARLLVNEVRAAAASHVNRRPARSPRPQRSRKRAEALADTTHRILAIGASTGGVTAIEEILVNLPPNMPGTVIVEHMPNPFSTTFAVRLNDMCSMQVREARDKDVVVPGVALIAPGGHDITLRRSRSSYVVRVADGSQVNGPHPNIDLLFHSVAEHAGANAVGAILTGMGADGAQGLLAMRQAGAETFAQDEKSCVVFGMPKEAIKAGAVAHVVPLRRMSGDIVKAFTVRTACGRA